MRIWRSLLFVPANQQRMLNKLDSLPADGYIFDLEDTVPPPEKPTARAMAREAIAKLPHGKCWIRCNSLPTGFIYDDFEQFVGVPGVCGFVVPKQDSAGDVAGVDRMLANIEVQKGLQPGSTPILVMIESAAGALFAHQVITAAKRIESVIYAGGEGGDMQFSLANTWSSEGPEMMLVRQMTFLAARAANYEFPLDGVYTKVGDLDGFKRDTALSKRLGFCGRTVIHPSQIEPANQLYMPSPAEVDFCRRAIEAYDAAVARGIASIAIDGRMVDVATIKYANRILDFVRTVEQRSH